MTTPTLTLETADEREKWWEAAMVALRAEMNPAPAADDAVRAYRERCAPAGHATDQDGRRECMALLESAGYTEASRYLESIVGDIADAQRCAPGASEPTPNGCSVCGDPDCMVRHVSDEDIDKLFGAEEPSTCPHDDVYPGEFCMHCHEVKPAEPLDTIRTAYYEGGESVDALEREHGRAAVAEALGFEHEESDARAAPGCDSPYCENGMTDSGGVSQSDEPIMVPCPECRPAKPSGAPTGPGWPDKPRSSADLDRWGKYWWSNGEPHYVGDRGDKGLHYKYGSVEASEARWGGPCLQGSAPCKGCEELKLRLEAVIAAGELPGEVDVKLERLTQAVEAALRNWAENGINPFDVEPTLRAALDAAKVNA